MKRAGLWAIGVLICCGGCGGDGGAAATNQNTIIGRWTADSIQAPGDVVRRCPTTVMSGGTTFACGVVDTQVFRPDGTYDEIVGGQRGTWSTSGNTLTVQVTGQPAVSYVYSVEGSTLTEQVFNGGGSVILRFSRQ